MKRVITLLTLAVAVAATAATFRLNSVFVLADSISLQYGPYLQYALDGQMEYGRKGSQLDPLSKHFQNANGGNSSEVYEYVASLQEVVFKPDLLILNAGLHDVRRQPDTHEYEVEPEQYRENLINIFESLHQQEIAAVWVNTTPVVNEKHNSLSDKYRRYNEDVVRYNEIAAELCDQYGIRLIDLYSFTTSLQEPWLIDHVHYNYRVRKQQAAFIAAELTGEPIEYYQERLKVQEQKELTANEVK